MNRIVIRRPSPVFAVKAPRGARACGNCRACCKTHAVSESAFHKPAGIWCKYCRAGVGCTIYEDRPHNCATFQCEWLRGNGEDDQRPDRVKVVLDYVKAPDGLPNGIMQIFELTEGALFSTYAKRAAREALAGDAVVLHLYLSGRRTAFVPVGKPSIRDLMEKMGDRDQFEFGRVQDLDP